MSALDGRQDALRVQEQSVAKRLNRFNLINLLMTLQHLTSCAGYGTDAESLLDQSKMRAYGLQFAGLGAAGGPGELQMQDLSPRAPGDGDDTDVEEGGPPGADGDGGSAAGGGSRGSLAAELPKAGCGPLERLQTESAAWHCGSACRPAERTAIVLGHRARAASMDRLVAHHAFSTGCPLIGAMQRTSSRNEDCNRICDMFGRSLDWRQNLEVLAARLKAPEPGAEEWLSSPTAVHIAASSQLFDLPASGPAATQAPLRPPFQQQLAPLQQERQLRHDVSFAHGSGIIGGGADTELRGGAGASSGAARSQPLPADDRAILGQHAAAINASMVAAGGRFVSSATAASGAVRGGRPLSDGGTTASMHSATSSHGGGGSTASTPRAARQQPSVQPQQWQQAAASNTAAGQHSQIRLGLGVEFAEESLF